ncbi:PRC-barrel domain-containing protein [Sulfitobacter pseudonitzschiae]|uniref:PRC-barrel domain-containing protein n=1 Tax=Pseudosulfitobacter pseudonitzschiae TaxID=1402135 RepID=A0A9Q2NSD7_9RHOB|nr:PRC-barrel domain-containing protein [Pseudosulfitobacter pseudonitzschiae]MBM2293529.1 PRC-barrel domain-containing protein [Pseudosulfitobacter pseudonitzschiae]MBM2298343.1 PRC-barrel domain-containing protein [Pseudosulfitobacter pseudonitzschiae]MBM2303257.1 PRC-barrel domain-containing protein [Pseudosulfitobacter pseudonitzschiae]MBM2313040.1 PRC-barrel domain-containing protein [Pseudosulfitobacter pseudonitzschiae]MBM2317953.1 PRC-barrel domain-containing protein [Pseudosulfitobact|tara:strand:+ start:138 stop:464 length:327 start_codon:yes stop_codon:yes gene_type:complete
MLKSLIVAAFTLPLASVAIAQTANVSGYTDIDDIDVIGSDGGKIGEVETVLVDDAGMPVAVVVEINDGFLDLGDSDVIMQMDTLTWKDGRYATTMTSDDISGLPMWDD